VWVDLDASDVEIQYFGPGDVEVTNLADLRLGMMARIHVEVTYNPAMPIVGAIVGPISMAADSEMPVERLHQSVSP
jgi:hypothetical protein